MWRPVGLLAVVRPEIKWECGADEVNGILAFAQQFLARMTGAISVITLMPGFHSWHSIAAFSRVLCEAFRVLPWKPPLRREPGS